ncbi:M48 family metallopeptidase [Streptomyces sp. N50]|uniref:M48 family metallopeptidase n=1 Tax=Streptomyces sp. N50 TaxID=3081765 RepID=UPI0029623D83|nr:M48 family metallopeptidase [Streptomyces sp. N50]WOX10204.1 M48 family metallopeptidase [Streptomyces sp. N50]
MGKPGRGVLSVSVRAALALGVIVGQYLLALAVLAVLAVVDVFLIRSGQLFTFNVLEGLVGSVAIAWVVVRSVFLVRRAERANQPAALPLTSAEQPGLWRRVREIAEQVGTRPPTELLLTADATALVQHGGRLWGLVPGERRLYIGAPLLIGLSAGELDAVLAHEMGHYANSDVRLEALVWAARDRLLRTVLALSGNSAKGTKDGKDGKEGKGGKGAADGPDHYLAKVFIPYARFSLRATQAVSRRQEFAADLVAAHVAGRDNAIAALRQLPTLEGAHDVYLAHYALMGRTEGFLPPAGQVHGGLLHFLADGLRQEEMSELVRNPPAEPSSPYDSHPPVLERIAAMEALPDDMRQADVARGGALALLREPHGVLVELEAAWPGTAKPEPRRVAWQELALCVRRAKHTRLAGPLRAAVGQAAAARGWAVGARSELDVLLDMIDRGLWFEAADLLPKSEVAARSGGRARREFARTAFRSALYHLSVSALAEAGHVTWEVCWAGPAVREVAPDGFGQALKVALDAATADPPDTAPLRGLLTGVRLR